MEKTVINFGITTTPEDIVIFDPETKEWFREHGAYGATLLMCPKCGMYYIPFLRHKPENCYELIRG